MTQPLHSTRRAALLAACALAIGLPAQAQNAPAKWPSGPVRFVVPFPAGAAPDVLIRLVGVKLSEKWGQPVVIDNKPGGSGVIGMKFRGDDHLLAMDTVREGAYVVTVTDAATGRENVPIGADGAAGFRSHQSPTFCRLLRQRCAML